MLENFIAQNCGPTEYINLNMQADGKIKALDYSVCKPYGILSVSGIYGYTAKEHIVTALQILSDIIKTSINTPICNNTLLPSHQSENIIFIVEFIANKKNITYSLTLNKQNTQITVKQERLLADKQLIFNRCNDCVQLQKKSTQKDVDRLFLTNGLSEQSIINKQLYADIIEWFSEKLIIMTPTSHIEPIYEETKKFIAQITNNTSSMTWYTSELARIVNAIIHAVKTGAVLIINGFDTIPSNAGMELINIIHNDDINKKNAQLIFTANNPVYMNTNVMRADEIKLVEINDIYSMADFPQNSKNRIEKYLMGCYGGIENYNITNLFDRKE